MLISRALAAVRISALRVRLAARLLETFERVFVLLWFEAIVLSMRILVCAHHSPHHTLSVMPTLSMEVTNRLSGFVANDLSGFIKHPGGVHDTGSVVAGE
jgi:hypothetical protein